MNALLAVIWKDLLMEWRHREQLAAMLLFACVTVVVLWFGLPVGNPAQRLAAAPGLLWIATLFAALLGVNRCFARELEDGAMAILALAPVDRAFLFLGKAAVNWVLLAAIAFTSSAVVAIILGIQLLAVALPFAAVAVLGTLGLATAGTLLAAISVHTRDRELTLPLIALPLLIPVLLGAIHAGSGLLGTGTLPRGAVELLIVTDAVYLVTSTLAFDSLLDE